ncbi:MAG: GH3 auxin-responsive promoter family protein [Alphaproteobacteria bacterium]|nr:GH3 auxin-responsive promoter family protein [Alphaproteobacteria bacterium]
MRDATPLLRLYGWHRRRRLARLDPVRTQECELLSLLRRARDTRFGRAHAFRSINSVADFQQQVPLRRYEDFWRDWLKPVFPAIDDVTWPGRIGHLAVSSGTSSGTTKWIPVSRQMIDANKRAALDVLTWHLNAKPQSRIFGGPSLVLGGSTGLIERAPGVRSGDLSGIAACQVPLWAQRRYFPPPGLALLENWDEKLDRIARAAPPDIRSISGTPSWLLILFERLAALSPSDPRRLASWFPDLELVVHGGVGFAPYQTGFARWLEGSNAETREVYAASEGFIAVADRGPGEGLRLILDNGLFHEFVPVAELGAESPTRHWIGNAETGIDYAIVLSTNAGLFGYVIGDAVRLVDRDPPRLLVTGRTSYSLSAFGEHVIGEELEHAVAAGARAIGAAVSDFSVGAIYPDERRALGRHLYIVEFDPPPDAAAVARFAAATDADLRARNEDYAAHRSGGTGMDPPEVLAVRPGFFADWMRARGKLGGQNKVPRVVSGALLNDLRTRASS